MFWMRAHPLLEQVGGGWALEFESFWALWNGIKPIGECRLGPKNSKSLKEQLAILKTKRFGKSSERLDKQIEEL